MVREFGFFNMVFGIFVNSMYYLKHNYEKDVNPNKDDRNNQNCFRTFMDI